MILAAVFLLHSSIGRLKCPFSQVKDVEHSGKWHGGGGVNVNLHVGRALANWGRTNTGQLRNILRLENVKRSR